MHLSEHSWTDADAAGTDVGVLPVGSTEQHGPHAPLGVDSLTAAAVAEAGAERYADEYGGEPLGAGLGDGLGGQRVDAQRRVGTVLFGAADGQDRDVGVGVPDVGPRRFGEVHTGRRRRGRL